MSTLTIYGTSASGTGWTNTANATGAPNSVFATWVSTTRNGTSSPLQILFSAPGLPEGSTVNSVSVQLKGYLSDTALFDYLQSTLYNSSSGAVSATVNHTLTTTSTNVWTAYSSTASLAELEAGLRLDVIGDRKNNTTSSTAFIDSAAITIDYTAPIIPPNEATVSDSVTFSDSASATAPAVPMATATATDALTFTDSATGKHPAPKASATDSLSISDTSTAARASVASTSLTVAFTGTASGIRASRATATDLLAISEAATGGTPVVEMNEATASDSLTVTDTATAVKVSGVYASDSISLTETATSYRMSRSSVNESFVLLMEANGMKESLATALESIVFGEFAAAKATKRGGIKFFNGTGWAIANFRMYSAGEWKSYPVKQYRGDGLWS